MAAGTPLNELGTPLTEVPRINCKVSDEVKAMWLEITAVDKSKADRKDGPRYYPAHTLERLVRADHDLLKAFGSGYK